MSIPADFPREQVVASLSGAQPKVAVRLDADSGKYVGRPTEEDVKERYEVCADLVTQLVAKCRANRSTKYAHLSEPQILERLFAQLLGTSWGSSPEMAWVIRTTAAQLSWSIPQDAAVLSTLAGDAP
jgi:hypothetical protein